MWEFRLLKQLIGATLIDLPRFLYRTWIKSGAIRQPGWAWNCNRDDSISAGPNGEGIICHWEHTRSLHATQVFPSLSTALLKRMLRDWPIELSDYPAENLAPPEVTFVIGHRGTARLPHLLMTLRSIAAQSGVSFECIVVEQALSREIERHLPSWIRYHFIQTPSSDYLYNRSWALNAGVRLARGRILVLHDSDMLLPSGYAAEMKAQVGAGFDVINLKRWIAYLDEISTKQVFDSQRLTGTLRSEELVASLCAGGSLGITRDAYFAIGAMDEEFVGWGGEDTEFWDRCQTLNVANHTYLPIVHLWHPSQPGKATINGLGAATADLYRKKMSVPAHERIRTLCCKTRFTACQSQKAKDSRAFFVQGHE